MYLSLLKVCIRTIFFKIYCSFYLVHKRFDPMYSDARDRIRTDLGQFSYFYSFMSQPKFQLDTFRACNFIFLFLTLQIKFLP